MSGSIDTSDILVVVDTGDQFTVNLQPPDQYGLSIQAGDTYVVNIDLPTTITSTQANSYFRVADYAVTASYISGSQSTIASASYAVTSSYALNAGAGSGFPFSGSAVITGSLLVSGGNIAGTLFGTASLTQAIIGGTARYIPLWTGSSGNELTSSIMYQTSKGIFIGYDTTPHVHSAEGETLAVHSGETGVKNVIYAHGTIDNDYRINLRNISNGPSASTNFKATADVGNDIGGYVEMGINSSTYSRTDQIGGPLDAYLFTTGSDLLIGTLSPDKRIILFTGPGDADNNARVFIDASGSVGINTSEVIANAPDALRVKAVPSVSTFNVITAIGLTDDYAQINMKNTGIGNSVSSDIVATANNGDENTNYVNMGINGETYTGTIGGPNDSYVYSTGGHLHLGAIDSGEEVRLFVGGNDTTLTTKLTLRDTNQHELSGSLNVTGSLNVLDGVINNLTASFAMTASYVSGAASTWNTISNKPENLVSSSIQVKNFLPTGTVSSSQQATTWTVLSASFASTASNINFTPATASFAVTASFAPTKAGVVSSSTQVNYAQLQNIPSGIVSSSTQIIPLLPTGVVSSSLQINTGSFSGSFTGTSSFAVSASRTTTASYVLPSGLPGGVISSSTQVITSLPTGTVSASLQINTGSFSGSFAGTSSWANNAVSSSFTTTASAATSITFIPNTASFATTASYAPTNAGVISSSTQVNYSQLQNIPSGIVSSSTQVSSLLPNGTVSSSTQIDYTQIQNKPTTIATASYVEYTNVTNKPTLVSASSQIQLNAITGVTFSNASFLFPQNLNIGGTLTAQEIRTEYVTSSVIFESGSTKFGDSADDTHQFTGSLTVLGTISGSVILPQGIVSSSTQAISWSVATASYVEYVNVANKPTLISSSTQVNYAQLQNIPSGIVSSSTQINTGSFSGSITSASFATSASWAPTILPSGIISSSLQINTGSFSGSFTGTFTSTSITASYISGGVVIIGLPTDGAYGGSAGNVSGISTGDKAEDAFDKIEVILGKLAPAKPANLSSRTLTTNATTYTAFSASGVTPISYTNVTANARPTASWTFSVATSGSGTTLTYDGDAGILQAEVDGIVSVASQDTLTTASDVGTFGNLIINQDLDPYNGTFGQQGFWKGFIASVAATQSLAVGPHTYRLLHSTTGNTPLFTWYLDNPTTPTVTVATGSSTGGTTRYVSGVPTLATGETVVISTTASNAVSQFYNGTRILAAVGNSSVASSVNATLPATPPISASLVSASITLTILSNAFSAASTYTVTAYNSAGTTATSTWTPTAPIRVDTISNESARCRSGIGWYPGINSTVSGAGALWTASANLTGSRELQMSNNIYQYPSATNYSTNYPTPGPNYVGLVAETTASFPGEAVRWATFSGSLTAASNVSVVFNNPVNFSGIATTGSMRLYVLVSGSSPTNGWIDGATAYPGVGNPTNNGDPALDVGNSTTTTKRITFGGIVKTGVVFVRVGIPSSSLAGSNRTFSGVTIT